MSSSGTPMPGLEKQRLLERVAQSGNALQYAAAELQADREIVATAVAQDGRALEHAAAELKRDPMLLQLQALNPRVSLPLLAAQVRLRLAYALTCKEWLDGNDAGTCLSLEVVELIGRHCTCTVAVLGLLRPLSEGVPPSA
jgi:hypothetical protein